MAEYLQAIQELQQIPSDAHLFCPRVNDDDFDEYNHEEFTSQKEENVDTVKRIDEAKLRREKFFSALPILAYDGPECEPYHAWIYEKLDHTLGKCELCIRKYYFAKDDFKTQLMQDYDEAEVQEFLQIINRRDLQRVQRGLDDARKKLESLPEQQRNHSALATTQLFAILEALHCGSFFNNEELLEKHFDVTFKLVRTKRELKSTRLLPAITRFLFDSKVDRVDWAAKTWKRLDRYPTDVEWDWAVRPILQKQIQQVQSHNDLVRLWSGLQLVIAKLSPDQIRHKLFDLSSNFAKLSLDHLSKDTFVIPQIVASLKCIFEKAPGAFWDAMGSVSASTVAEQVFASPRFNKCLETSAKPEHENAGLDVLSWMVPFLECLNPANRPPPCQTICFQLFSRIHSDNISPRAKRLCFKFAVTSLTQTVVAFNNDDMYKKSSARLVIYDALNTTGSHLEDIFRLRRTSIEMKEDEDVGKDILSLISNSLALECQCLKSDFEMLTQKQTLGHSSSYSPDIWQTIVDNLDENDEDVSAAALRGIMALPGLELFRCRDGEQLPKQRQVYNSMFEKITGMVSKLLEKMAEFPSNHLDPLFSTQDTSMSLVATLFSADQATYQAAVDLIKNISGMAGRREALSHMLEAFLSQTVYSLCWVFRRVANMKTFASVPRLLRTGMDIMGILCDATGILGSKRLEERDVAAIQSYWSYQWLVLGTIFRRMEQWSLEVHDKPLMTDVCRDTMQYAQELFKHYHLFLKILQDNKPAEKAAKVPKDLLNTDEKSAAGSPPKCLDAMVKWLRLRDVYLAETLVTLIIDMLRRLKDYGSLIANDSESLTLVEKVASTTDSKNGIRTILSANQKAELIRSLEQYTGRQIAPRAQMVKKQRTLQQWTEPAGNRSGSSTPAVEEDFGDDAVTDADLYELDARPSAEQKAKSASRDKQILQLQSRTLPPKPTPQVLSLRERQEIQKKNSRSFIEERKQAELARKARDREAVLKARGKSGSEQTTGAGSGLSGLGVKGKDHSAGQNNIMVSSDSESNSDDDDELFGGKIRSEPLGADGLRRVKPTTQGPVRKVKQLRSVKDMRARLAPDLTKLHDTLLSWDFFSESETPPNSGKDDYTLVTNTFRSVADYQKTFEPLLVLEGWQSFRSAREDGDFKPFDIKVASSLLVDNSFEINTEISMVEGKELRLGVADIVLLSKGRSPHTEPGEPHCLARVKEVTRKKGEIQIVYRVNATQNSLRSHLNPKATIHGIKILSLTPLEREYGALMALPYYDLCDEIINAKPSPLLDYSDAELRKFQEVYTVNTAQAKAVKSAIDNDAFTLIQGPPGSGKTKTICALVGAIMTGFIKTTGAVLSRAPLNGRPSGPPSSKKILVCAPSNAAVDELVMRFKEGVKMMDGSKEKVNIVRLGRTDAINTAVKDVTLEELVNARLSQTTPDTTNNREDIHTIMMEHKSVCDEMTALRQKFDDQKQKQEAISLKDQGLMEALRTRRSALSTKIDDKREKQNSASRDADINRRRVQQEILDSAHVLCATLSGSGHEIFQGLNVEFETVVIDEAAQSIELSALIPLKYGCSKCILVGDPKQLPPTVLSRQAAKYQYEQSLFARMEGNHKKDVHLLDTQYRMHPEISVFPSKTFYDSRLQDGPDMARQRARPWHRSEILAPYRFFDVQGLSETSSKGHSMINQAEIKVALRLYDRLISDVSKYNFSGNIGIITPYKGQLMELKRQFTRQYGEQILSSIDFNTTDAFQGRESEIIIFSCVRASTKGIGFLNDVRRMNVGLTRAKCSLWVLGSSQSLVQGEFWRALVHDAKLRNLYTNGDVLRLLSRPLLTEDMMKDDIVMADADPVAPVDDIKPKTVLRESAASANGDRNFSRKNSSASESTTLKTEIPTTKIKTEDIKILSSDGRTAPASRPDTLSRKSPNVSLDPRLQRRVEAAAASKDKTTVQPGSNSKDRIKRESVTEVETQQHDYRKPASSVETQAQLQDQASKLTGYSPSGGSNGLNDLLKCSFCGSHSHSHHECDNDEAKKAAIQCNRCKKGGHIRMTCSESRCVGCGVIGHLEINCPVPPTRRLSRPEQENVKREELRFESEKQRHRERRAERQLGEYARAIPTVQTSHAPQGASRGSVVDVKRKREDGIPTRPAKTMRLSGDGGHPTVATNGSAGNSNGDGAGHSRLPPVAPRQMVKKKRTTADDMFLKKR